MTLAECTTSHTARDDHGCRRQAMWKLPIVRESTSSCDRAGPDDLRTTHRERVAAARTCASCHGPELAESPSAPVARSAGSAQMDPPCASTSSDSHQRGEIFLQRGEIEALEIPAHSRSARPSDWIRGSLRVISGESLQRHLLCHVVTAGARGSTKQMRTRSPCAGSAQIVPPCASTIERQIARPRPAPRRSACAACQNG
jgi:hypothetical protein